MKKRISLTIDEKLLKLLDRNRYKSRSSAIEDILKKYFNEKIAVILAGGPSEHLWIPKLKRYRPLVKIGKKTLMEDIMDKVIDIEYKKFIFIGSKEIIEAVKKEINEEYDITFIEENKFGGTASTLYLARNYIKNTFLILPCDHYFDFSLKELEHVHNQNNFIITLAVYAGAGYEWNKSAFVKMNGHEITEYSDNNIKTHLTSTMISFAEPEIFDMIKNRKSLEEIFLTLIQSKKLGGVIINGNFVNIHSVNDLLIARRLR